MRRADPVGALLGVVDRRARQQQPSMAQLAKVVGVDPDLIVEFENKQRVKNPLVLRWDRDADGNSVALTLGQPCLMIPIQEGHDFALLIIERIDLVVGSM